MFVPILIEKIIVLPSKLDIAVIRRLQYPCHLVLAASETNSLSCRGTFDNKKRKTKR